jgi:hypothetical protein
MEARLKRDLAALEQTLRRTRLLRHLTLCWLAAAAAGFLLLLLQGITGWTSALQWIVPALAALAATGVVWRRHRNRAADLRAVVAAVEREHPQLRHLLSAAAEQEPDAVSGGFRFLQLRVIDEVLAHPLRQAWKLSLERKLSGARISNMTALAGFLCVLAVLAFGATRARPVFASVLARGITVAPGDTEVERGTTLVISARFGGEPPAEATLVLLSASGQTKRIPLERHLADPVFGASLREVSDNGLYHIEYGGAKTGDYKITVFDYPALVRADALLHFPAYTGLSNKMIPDSRRISAVEGSRLSYTLQLNKPVTRARLVGTNQTLALALQNNSVALLNDFPLTNSARYSLALEDAAGRTNKFPTDIFIQVLPNKRPELKLLFPSGDQRVSRLQELQLEGEAADEFGLLKYGIGLALAGEQPRFVELGRSAPGREKRRFTYLVCLEDLGLQVNQVLSYFVWADDFGPDGKPRRTVGDMFFAEVRPFDEVFRPDQSGMSGGQEEGQQGGNQGVELAEFQKEIAAATWKLEQEQSPPASTSP